MKIKLSYALAVIAVILVFTGIFIFTVISPLGNVQEETKVIREPAVAGRFYPGNANDLGLMISGYLDLAGKTGVSNIRGLVAPHAGYPFSGPVAAYGFSELRDQAESYETVIIIGPSHHVMFNGASIANATHYKTPLGLVKLSSKVEQLMEENVIVSIPEAHLYEHSVEVEIPFLQKVLRDFEIIPIVTGNINPEDLASVLSKYMDDKTLIVASSDLSHYYPYEEADELDQHCIDSIPHLNFTGMGRCEACGKIPVLTLMYIAEELGWPGKVLDYRNSGDTAGDKSRVVGYISVAFYEE